MLNKKTLLWVLQALVIFVIVSCTAPMRSYLEEPKGTKADTNTVAVDSIAPSTK